MAAQAEVTEESNAERKDSGSEVSCSFLQEAAPGEGTAAGIRRDVPGRGMTGWRFRKDAADSGAFVLLASDFSDFFAEAASECGKAARAGAGEFSIEKAML